MQYLTLFVNILYSFKYVYLGILSSLMKFAYVKQQVFLFLQKVYVEIFLIVEIIISGLPLMILRISWHFVTHPTFYIIKYMNLLIAVT